MFTHADFEEVAERIAEDADVVGFDDEENGYTHVLPHAIYDDGGELDYNHENSLQVLGYDPILTLAEFADLAQDFALETRDDYAAVLADMAYGAYLDN